MSEFAIQKAYFQWVAIKERCDKRYKWAYSSLNGIWLPTNDTKLKQIIIGKMKDSGMKTGVADVCIPYPNAKFHGLYIEFKDKGKKPTKEQAEFLSDMRKRNYAAGYCDDLDKAIRLTEQYMLLD